MSIIPQMSTPLYLLRKKLILWIVVLGITACEPDKPMISPTLTPYRDIFAYHTYTPNPGPINTKSVKSMPMTPDSTATPFSHTVEKGETMLGIAIQYGIELEDLQAANSQVDPNMLSVGTQLIIPINDDVQTSMMTPTPVPVSLRAPDCYFTADQGAWCFVLVENGHPYAMENVSAWVSLISEQGDLINDGIAFSPLNLIDSGENIPLTVFFELPVPTSFKAEARLLTAVAISSKDNRYLESAAEIGELIVNPNGLSAIVNGNVIFPDNTRYPGVVWLAVVAYSKSGKVVGVRKWEVVFPQTYNEPLLTVSPDDLNTVNPVSLSPLPFEILVYSLGPAIERVEVISEARP